MAVKNFKNIHNNKEKETLKINQRLSPLCQQHFPLFLVPYRQFPLNTSNNLTLTRASNEYSRTNCHLKEWNFAGQSLIPI